MAASVENRLFNRVERGCNVPPSMNPVDPFMSRLKNSPAMFQEDSSSDEEDWEWSDLKRGWSAADDLEPSILDKRDQGTADSWVLRHPSLIRLTGKHPFNSEPPLSRLMQHGFITPTQLHYVRNHGPVPRATWHEWTVEVCGLVKRPARFTMDQLVSEFPSREFPVTLVCAGNRRKEQNMVKQTVGFNWGPSAVSTSVWRGVPLRCILKRCGILSRRRGALNVCFEGAEDLPGGGGSKYGTSLRKEIAMDPSRDILVAYLQNGERLAPDHGFPVRIIIPGFIGGRMVKWLRRIIVTTPESDSYYHFNDNRVLPSHVDAELANSQAWWYRPEYIINELNINSVITTPSHDEILHINAWTAQRPYTLRGYAYSGGGKKVTRVEVTTDGGESWHVCEVERPEKPNKYGKYWCWCFWRVDVEVVDLIRAKEIAVRAWDETHNTQPENLTWNLMGMMNNCWYRVKASLLREVGIRFEHPIQAGNQPGGWMTSQKPLPNSPEPTHAAPKNSVPSNSYSLSELSKHNSAESAWIAVHGHVYDCTRFLKDHPGGTDSILINAGTDCTEEFDSIHSDKAKKLLQDFRVGDLIAEASPPTTKETSSVTRRRRRSALIPREKIQCRLESKEEVTRDVRRFRFALPDPDQVLGLPVGKHIFLCATVHGKPCMRAYTPTSVSDEIGHFELVVKVYFPGENPKFPSGGAMSQYLESLPVGSKLDVKGPTGHIEYAGRGVFTVHGKPRRARRLAMIAGGTGITPIYQVIQAVLGDPSDETEMFLVYANRTEEDILLWDELEEWAGRSGGRLKVWYVVGESVREGWKYSLGFVTEEILREHVPEASEGTLALACGPPPMIKFAVAPGLEKMGYDVKESLLVF